MPMLSCRTMSRLKSGAMCIHLARAPQFGSALRALGIRSFWQSRCLLTGLLFLLVVELPAEAQSNWTYQGRTVTISISSPAGGGYDTFGRLLARHLSRHLPGNPSVIVKNMPGAGGLVLANYLQNTAPRDGTEFGEFEHGTAFTGLLTATRVSFDPLAFGWLGSMEQFTPIVAVWHTVPVYSPDDLLKTPINVGTSGVGSTTGDIRTPSMRSSGPNSR